MVHIEARRYGPDMSDEERATLLSRVVVLEERLIFYEEIPVQSVASIELMMGRMWTLSRAWPSFVEVLDLSTVSRPDPVVRVAIRRQMREFAPTLLHMAVIVDTNVVIRAVARFFSYSMNLPQVSFHETKEEALVVARQIRG